MFEMLEQCQLLVLKSVKSVVPPTVLQMALMDCLGVLLSVITLMQVEQADLSLDCQGKFKKAPPLRMCFAVLFILHTA